MSGFLLDTHVISELIRPRPHTGVVQWIESVDESLLFLSVLTLGEIRKGVALLTDGRKRVQLEEWLEIDLRSRFAGRILSIDNLVADRWGSLSARAQAGGTSLPVIDGLLAATALEANLTFVSRDTLALEKLGIAIFDPWQKRT